MHRAEQCLKSLFRHITYQGPITRPHEEYKEIIKSLCSKFIAACQANSSVLGDYIAEAEKHIGHKPLSDVVDEIAAKQDVIAAKQDKHIRRTNKIAKKLGVKNQQLSQFFSFAGKKVIK